MRISDWSSDVCSSDLERGRIGGGEGDPITAGEAEVARFEADLALPVADRDLQGVGTVDETVQGQEPALEQVRIRPPAEIGRASCRERVCQSVSISGVAVYLKKKQQINNEKQII